MHAHDQHQTAWTVIQLSPVLLTVTFMRAGWVLANMIPFFYILKKLHLFRVSPEDEALGLDASYHGGSAYPGESESDVAFSWGPSPLERSNGKPPAAPGGDAGASVPTTNVILSKEAKAQQVHAWPLLLHQSMQMLLYMLCRPGSTIFVPKPSMLQTTYIEAIGAPQAISLQGVNSLKSLQGSAEETDCCWTCPGTKYYWWLVVAQATLNSGKMRRHILQMILDAVLTGGLE